MKYFTKVTFLHTSDHGEIVRICFILYSLTINHSFPLIAGNRGMSNVSCSQNSLNNKANLLAGKALGREHTNKYGT